MTQRLRFASFILLAAAATWMMPAATADERDKLTIMTFTEPVEIPGQILPAGTYVFKLLDSNAGRNVVQIFTQDQKQLVATIMALPDYRLLPTRDTTVRLEERSAGSPEALHSWFYPGDNYGIQFVYPKAEQRFADRSEPAAPAVQTLAAAPTPEPEPAPPATAMAVETAPSETTFVTGEKFLIGQEVPADPADNGPAIPATLPQTAGNFAILPLVGMLLLSGGLTAIRFAARQN